MIRFIICEQLKLNDKITSYYWMVNYTSDYEGNLIIGEPPHIFDPKHYKKENLVESYPFLYRTMLLGWGLRFDEILFQDNNFRPFHECFFKHELNYIRGISEFQKILDIYFNESINNGTCFKEPKVKYPYSPHTFFYCNKDKYKDNIKYFPSLKFEHKELKYTFELTYKDLFIEKHDKLILMVFFDDSGMDWYLGKPFLRKYSFLMNPDSKNVGFYTKIESDESDDNNNNENNNIVLEVVLIVIGLIILLIIGIFIGKYFICEKKKPINVIDDDYEYKTKDEEYLCNNNNKEETIN